MSQVAEKEQQGQKQLQPSEEQRKAEHKLTKRQQNLADPNYPNQRTIQQNKKQEEAKKSDTRDEGKESLRSRSQSRRNRRKRVQEGIEDGKHMKTNSLEALEEADATGDLKSMQMFERIGPDSTSMDGPVTHARAMRGEIPIRGKNSDEPYYMPQEEAKKSSLAEQDGLKLTIEANLEIEIELKASIRGDLTLSLYTVGLDVLSERLFEVEMHEKTTEKTID